MPVPRRSIARAAAALLLALGVALLLGSGPVARSAEPLRPNVVVIMTDDQTLESLRVMRNVRRLIGREGATFDDSIVSFPLCCPSRAAFLTGRYSHNTGVVGNNLANGLARLDETNTLPVWLSAAGYSTIFVGKYLNGYARLHGRAVPPGWTEWYAGMTLAYFKHSMSRNGALVRYGTAPQHYGTDVYTQTAVDAIRRHAAGPVPFFLWLSYFAPHYGGPRESDDPQRLKTPAPAPRHRDAFALEPLPRPASFGEEDVADKPAAVQRRPPLDDATVAELTESYQQRLESLLAVDEGVARVVAALRAAGALERTLIVFTSDNGYLLGEHRIAQGKEHLYEPSVRVPLLVRGPGVPRGVRYRQPVVNVDLAPTIAAAAGVTPGLQPDGRSLLPLFAEPTLEWGRDILLERGPGGNSVADTWIYTALRTPRFLYAEHLSGERELYDLAADPRQLASVHADPAYAEIRTELARRLAPLRDCVAVSCAQGPALTLGVQTSDGCARAVTVYGGDERLVDYVELDDNGARHRIADPPFGVALGAGGAQAAARVRATAVLVDGRRVTLTAPVRRCS